MGLNKSLDSLHSFSKKGNKKEQESSNPWLFDYPNNADFNFNYYNLLNNANQNSIGNNTNPAARIAIIGAGISGMVAARELFRSGYKNIDIYEASDRIGGRTYSQPVNTALNKHTTYEMGAMRMPFFTDVGSKNCLLDYYRQLFRIQTKDFPDPGSAAVKTTGVYLNDGQGTNPKWGNAPSLILWEGGQNPPDPALLDVYEKWNRFATMVSTEFQRLYATSSWESFWQSVVQTYWQLNFRELAYLPTIDSYQGNGNFGGLGMTVQEAQLFYTIGAGDGSWGAFYDISCLYIFRTLLSGYGTNHQLIIGNGAVLDDKDAMPIPDEATHNVRDKNGNLLTTPSFLGVQSFAESMFYLPVTSQNDSNGVSLYQASRMYPNFDINLMTQTPVTNIIKDQDNGKIYIATPLNNILPLRQLPEYDQVIITPTTWALQTSSLFTGFNFDTQLPFEVVDSIKSSHWITSCKIFYPLRKKYWEDGVSKIPQIITTDTYLQDIYAYSATDSDEGVLLLSYTWEDDANKLLALSDNQTDKEFLAQQCLDFLDDILMRCENIQERVSRYVDTSQPIVFQWALQPTYRGCAKLYRETSFNENYSLLTYNQEYAKESGIYFAGEAYSLEGGWTEPAIRLGVDAVLNLMNNTGATFNNGFSMDLYPKYSDWKPELNMGNVDLM
ncbi:FAD-dependent oxidoreductase [Bernardetia sp. ABR2-2B]|uniref:flavin monoamine oxidase family protein n=1 Tax=Bernardetia sp. ABR2-2B TaxID=3127472 RepID=UPI0030D2592E